MAIEGRPTRAVVSGAVLAVAAIGSFVLVVAVFIMRAAGQRIDETALRGARIGQSRVIEGALSLLHLVSGVGLVSATLAIAVVACTRRRWDLAAAAVVIVAGANVTTQVLKHLIIDRPNVGIDTYTINSLPSGHTTVAVSLSVALVLVSPRRAQGACALVGAAVSTLMGIATLAAGWHRPSDVVAATCVVAAWTGVAHAGLAVGGGARGTSDGRLRSSSRSRQAGAATTLLIVGGLGLLAAAVLSLWRTSRFESIPTDRLDLLVGYAGGAAGIGAVVSLVLAAALSLSQSLSLSLSLSQSLSLSLSQSQSESLSRSLSQSAAAPGANVTTTSEISVNANVSGA